MLVTARFETAPDRVQGNPPRDGANRPQHEGPAPRGARGHGWVFDPLVRILETTALKEGSRVLLAMHEEHEPV